MVCLLRLTNDKLETGFPFIHRTAIAKGGRADLSTNPLSPVPPSQPLTSERVSPVGH